MSSNSRLSELIYQLEKNEMDVVPDYNIDKTIISLSTSFIGLYTFKEEKHETGEPYYDVKFYDIEPEIRSEIITDISLLNDRLPYLNIYLYYTPDMYIYYVDSTRKLKTNKMTGNDIINMCIDFARNNDIERISLEDQSSLDVTLPSGISLARIDLAALNILCSGRSWYNKFGFKQENYENNMKEWKIIRKSTLRQAIDLFDQIEEVDFKNYFDDPFALCGLTDEIDFKKRIFELCSFLSSKDEYVDSEISKVAVIIQNNIRSGLCNDDELLIYQCIYINSISMILNYSRDLMLEI